VEPARHLEHKRKTAPMCHIDDVESIGGNVWEIQKARMSYKVSYLIAHGGGAGLKESRVKKKLSSYTSWVQCRHEYSSNVSPYVNLKSYSKWILASWQVAWLSPHQQPTCIHSASHFRYFVLYKQHTLLYKIAFIPKTPLVMLASLTIHHRLLSSQLGSFTHILSVRKVVFCAEEMCGCTYTLL
jgi:hypothetical protein